MLVIHRHSSMGIAALGISIGLLVAALVWRLNQTSVEMEPALVTADQCVTEEQVIP